MRVLAEKTVSSAEGEKALILAKAKERLAKNEEKLRKEENAKKPDLFKVVLAQAASEAVQLKTREEIPPPTNKEIGQKHGKKVMGLVRKGDWNGGGEQLKEVNEGLVLSPFMIHLKLLLYPVPLINLFQIKLYTLRFDRLFYF